MAFLDFPSSPTLNQTYTLNGKTWKWDGTVWQSATPIDISIGLTGTVPVSNGGTGLVSAGTSGNVLTSNGTYWVSQTLPASEVTSSNTVIFTNKTMSGANNTVNPNEFMLFAVSDEATPLTTGTAKITFRTPFAMTLYQLPRASLSTVSSSGNPTVDIKAGGTTIFSTTLSIDANEKTSTTAATPAVLSTTSIADDTEMTVDITTAGTGAKGLKVTLYYRRT